MEKLSNTTPKGILPEFQEFLLTKNLVPEKNAPFYAYWVGKFLNYARQRQLPTGEYQEPAVIEFLEALKTDRPISDWQHRQTVDAIRLYFFHYRGQTKNKLTTDVPAENVSQIMEELKRLIRLKHYSYSTERTYLQWAERFLVYALQTGREKTTEVEAEDFKNFISHLALKKRVSASTQNQAFNAILFLFRNVLNRKPVISAGRSGPREGRNFPWSYRLMK